MRGKMVLFFLTSLFLSIGIAPGNLAPLSDHFSCISLIVQSEVMDKYRMVISLQPLSIDAGNSPKEFPIPLGSALRNVTKIRVFMEETLHFLVDDETTAQLNNEKPKLHHDNPEFDVDYSLHTSVGNGTRIGTFPPTVTRLAVMALPPVEPTDDKKFLITVPNIQCPEGYRPDANGKCREIVSSRRSSSSSSSSHGGWRSNSVWPADRESDRWRKGMFGYYRN